MRGESSMNIIMFLAGFLFLFIIVTITASSQLGNKITFGGSELDAEAKLQDIVDNPKKFRMSVYLALVEHGAIIALAIVMFVVFGPPYSLILGSVWLIARTVEGLINFNSQKNYWRLLNISRQYSGTSGSEKEAMSDSCRTIVETKNYRFSFAQILFSIGTLAYALVFTIYGAVPVIIGWFGIVASLLYGFGNGIILAKPKNQVLAQLGGLLIFIFEAALGIWLMYSSLFIL